MNRPGYDIYLKKFLDNSSDNYVLPLNKISDIFDNKYIKILDIDVSYELSINVVAFKNGVLPDNFKILITFNVEIRRDLLLEYSRNELVMLKNNKRSLINELLNDYKKQKVKVDIAVGYGKVDLKKFSPYLFEKMSNLIKTIKDNSNTNYEMNAAHYDFLGSKYQRIYFKNYANLNNYNFKGLDNELTIFYGPYYDKKLNGGEFNSRINDYKKLLAPNSQLE